jgi:hypothetical protein
LNKGRIRARFKGELPITFSDERLSAYGGLELFARYVRAVDLPGRLRSALRWQGLEGDYGAVRMTLALLGLLVIGGWRVAHLAFVGSDPILLRFCGLQRMPSARTVRRWLERFSPTALEALATVIRDGVYRQIARLGLRRLTLDLDGMVLRASAQMEGAARGYSPHHPKDPSYYPLTAHVAQLGQILRVWNRPGNVVDSHNADGFLRVVVRELRERFGRALRLEVRLDGAFFMPGVLRALDEEELEYAIKVPFWKWLGLRELIAVPRPWRRVARGIEGFESALVVPKWGRVMRVAIYRKHLSGPPARAFQLDLFQPDDGYFEYSAVGTNKELSLAALWQFMAGRGGHEKTLGELKHHLGFAAIPSLDRQANAAWQQLSVLALNLVRSFQIALGAPRRRRSWKRTFEYVLRSVQTLRFELFQQPARLLRPGGRVQIRFAAPAAARRRIQRAERRLRHAA